MNSYEKRMIKLFISHYSEKKIAKKHSVGSLEIEDRQSLFMRVAGALFN